MRTIAETIADGMARENRGSSYDENLGKIHEYYRKGLTFPASMRGRPFSDVISISEHVEECNDPLSGGFNFHMNDQNRVAEMIRRSESGVVYCNEGLIETYPVDKFVENCRKSIRRHADPELLDENVRTIDPSFKSPDGSDVTIGEYYRMSKPVKGISADVEFVIPVAVGESEGLEGIVKMVSDDIYVYGYTIAAIRKWSGTFTSSSGKKFNAFVVAFEARFSDYDFKLFKVLYHVSPSRFVRKVARNGIVPKSKSGQFAYPDRVYLFNRQSEVGFDRFISYLLGYMTMKMKDMADRGLSDRKFDSGMCMYQIDTDKLTNSDQYKRGKLKFYADAFVDGIELDPSKSTSIFTYGNIGREFIDDKFFFFRFDPDTAEYSGKVDVMSLSGVR